jgi:hypothetical protein
MRRIALFAIVAAFTVPLMASAPAHAQANRTWVSGVGDDLNPCSRTAPCKTFAGAISKTAPGGEINCLDPGGFGGVTITKSMTIACEGTIGAILAANTTGIIINAAASDRIVLKNLSINGGPLNQPGINGIRVLSAASLHVEDCNIFDFTAASPNGFGIKVETAANFHLLVTRTSIFNNGASGTTGGGILIKPTGGITNGTLSKVVIDRNVTGLALDGFGGTTGINLTVRDSTISGNFVTGALVTSTIGSNLLIDRSTISNNGTGLLAANAGATIRVGSSSLSSNGTAVNGANVLSYGNNMINANAGGEAINLVAPGGGLK